MNKPDLKLKNRRQIVSIFFLNPFQDRFDSLLLNIVKKKKTFHTADLSFLIIKKHSI